MPLQSAQFWMVSVGLVVAAGIVLVIFNALIRMRNDIARTWSNIDVILQQRHNEVGNLVNSVRDYMNYERALLVEITEARNRLARANGVHDKAVQDKRLHDGLDRLFVTIENYPDVKANHLVRDLMRRITELEDMLADRREVYNHSVTRYNTMIASVPIVFVAGPLGFKGADLFSAENEARRRPEVSLR